MTLGLGGEPENTSRKKSSLFWYSVANAEKGE